MRSALVVYESMFGNTERVARAIGTGLAEHGLVDVRNVADIEPSDVTKVQLLVLGGPTHAFSLSRPTTRRDAVKQGATCRSVDIGLREWISGLTPAFLPDRIATFDTRVARARHLPGSAARKAASLLRSRGWPVAGRKSFFVLDTDGPVLTDELDRAVAWGRHLAAGLAPPQHNGQDFRPMRGRGGIPDNE